MAQRQKALLIAAALAAGFGFALVAGSFGRPATELAEPRAIHADAPEQQVVSAEQAWQRLKAGNSRFVEGTLEMPDLGVARRQELSTGQKPFAVVLTCADSRLTPEFIFNQGLGDLFVLRVAGNIADPFELGTIEYAVEHLHVPLIVILGHEKCGAVEAALGEQRPSGNLGKLIAEIHTGKELPADKEAALAAAVKNNVRRQTHLLTQRSDPIKEHVARKEVRIVSGVYQLATGKVEWLQEEEH
jgi:carbonic anhydrase